MRNIKVEKKLIGDEWWPKMPILSVSGNEEAETVVDRSSIEEKEKTIQSWNRVAVLKVSPSVNFKVGFIAGDHSQFLKDVVETKGGLFGMRLGKEEAKFFVLPVDLESELSLELVEIVNENEEKYKDLPLY